MLTMTIRRSRSDEIIERTFLTIGEAIAAGEAFLREETAAAEQRARETMASETERMTVALGDLWTGNTNEARLVSGDRWAVLTDEGGSFVRMFSVEPRLLELSKP